MCNHRLRNRTKGDTMGTAVPDRIEQEILIDAPPERVWGAITEAEHLGTWFGDAGAEVDLRPGGRVVLRWSEHGEFFGRVEQVEAPRLFAVRWARPQRTEPEAGNSTLVEFTLEPEDGQTRLRVVESGFQLLAGTPEENAEYAAGNIRGWTQELAELREYVGRGAAVRS
jgi:uncharacterized protein YndB with AHSA1/START domain